MDGDVVALLEHEHAARVSEGHDSEARQAERKQIKATESKKRSFKLALGAVVGGVLIGILVMSREISFLRFYCSNFGCLLVISFNRVILSCLAYASKT